ncbi:MAG TPA: discoidin domain-containing protein [Thermoanaerobaculia bacterium]
MRAAIAVALALVATAAAPQARDDPERGNLLNFAYGASVVSRTAELTLDQSALRAIDGDPLSSWNSPPDDTNQTMVFALPARTRVEKIGVLTPRLATLHATSIQVDSSLDGKTFSPVATLKPEMTDDVQFFAVQPREALYVRVTTLGATGRYASIASVQVRGAELEPVVQRPIDGCWSVNGFPATFTNDRGRITGTIGDDHPISFDGGSDGRVDRFVWTSGPDWGFGAMTTAPDGQHFSGLRWYVEPNGRAAAESWFGQRAKCGTTPHQENVAQLFAKRARRLPLYGLRFDDKGALIEGASGAALDMLARLPASSRFRLVSREFRQANADENRRLAKVRLDSLRAALQKRGLNLSHFDWQAAGSDAPPMPIESEIMRVLYGTIELQAL